MGHAPVAADWRLARGQGLDRSLQGFQFLPALFFRVIPGVGHKQIYVFPYNDVALAPIALRADRAALFTFGPDLPVAVKGQDAVFFAGALVGVVSDGCAELAEQMVHAPAIRLLFAFGASGEDKQSAAVFYEMFERLTFFWRVGLGVQVGLPGDDDVVLGVGPPCEGFLVGHPESHAALAALLEHTVHTGEAGADTEALPAHKAIQCPEQMERRLVCLVQEHVDAGVVRDGPLMVDAEVRAELDRQCLARLPIDGGSVRQFALLRVGRACIVDTRAHLVGDGRQAQVLAFDDCPVESGPFPGDAHEIPVYSLFLQDLDKVSLAGLERNGFRFLPGLSVPLVPGRAVGDFGDQLAVRRCLVGTEQEVACVVGGEPEGVVACRRGERAARSSGCRSCRRCS